MIGWVDKAWKVADTVCSIRSSSGTPIQLPPRVSHCRAQQPVACSSWREVDQTDSTNAWPIRIRRTRACAQLLRKAAMMTATRRPSMRLRSSVKVEDMRLLLGFAATPIKRSHVKESECSPFRKRSRLSSAGCLQEWLRSSVRRPDALTQQANSSASSSVIYTSKDEREITCSLQAAWNVKGTHKIVVPL